MVPIVIDVLPSNPVSGLALVLILSFSISIFFKVSLNIRSIELPVSINTLTILQSSINSSITRGSLCGVSRPLVSFSLKIILLEVVWATLHGDGFSFILFD